MLGKLLLAFVLVPLVDLYVLLLVAGRIGGLQTLGLVVLTGVVGGTLAKVQGVQTVRRLQHRTAKGESPSRELADGALILFGGALLLTPGLITDGIGFALLLPFVRPRIRSVLSSYLGDAVRRDAVVVEVDGAGDVDVGGDSE
ncbi:FxsA family protein [Haladaptatus sp. F3-133]|uniref:FxsA family protein n=1 Tax=Halorutilus salinus TaxID=2487751 RepID=A0A9Q4C0W9_9EURY|nr:FxsA family protein [Halorutilus salinus]